MVEHFVFSNGKVSGNLPDLWILNQINHFFLIKKLLKLMVRKGLFDSQIQNLCVFRHHFLIYKIIGTDNYISP